LDPWVENHHLPGPSIYGNGEEVFQAALAQMDTPPRRAALPVGVAR
jgi:hypothetical protein